MEDLEDTQNIDEYALPDAPPPDAGKFSLIMKLMNILRKEGKIQIMNNLIQCMLILHNIKSKR